MPALAPQHVYLIIFRAVALSLQRYVPDEVLRFKTVAYMDSGTYIPFPSEEGIDPRAFTTSPANFKVELTVSAALRLKNQPRESAVG